MHNVAPKFLRCYVIFNVLFVTISKENKREGYCKSITPFCMLSIKQFWRYDRHFPISVGTKTLPSYRIVPCCRNWQCKYEQSVHTSLQCSWLMVEYYLLVSYDLRRRICCPDNNKCNSSRVNKRIALRRRELLVIDAFYWQLCA